MLDSQPRTNGDSLSTGSERGDGAMCDTFIQRTGPRLQKVAGAISKRPCSSSSTSWNGAIATHRWSLLPPSYEDAKLSRVWTVPMEAFSVAAAVPEKWLSYHVEDVWKGKNCGLTSLTPAAPFRLHIRNARNADRSQSWTLLLPAAITTSQVRWKSWWIASMVSTSRTKSLVMVPRGNVSVARGLVQRHQVPGTTVPTEARHSGEDLLFRWVETPATAPALTIEVTIAGLTDLCDRKVIEAPQKRGAVAQRTRASHHDGDGIAYS